MSSVFLPPLLSIDEAAVLLRVTYADASRAVLSGELPCVVEHGSIAVPTYELLRSFGVSASDARTRLNNAHSHPQSA